MNDLELHLYFLPMTKSGYFPLKKGLLFPIFISLNFCICSEQIEDIYAAIDCESILPILMKYGLNTETYPMTLSFAANSALLCISEENDQVAT